jgi:cytochrome c oxidase assembly protein subunit 15
MGAMARRLGTDRPRITVSPRAFVRLSVASLVGLLVIIPSGALVRLTDSGLGCPDWPGCHGEVIPPMSGHAWIEYTNRVFSAVVVGLAVLTWLAATRVPGRPKGFARLAALPAIAGVAQGPLGGLTVVFDLHPLLVASHFLLSILALAAGVLVVVAARDLALGRRRETDRRPAALVGVALIGLLGVIVTGVLVTAAGPHSGDPAVVRRLGQLGDAAAVHVRFVIAFVVLCVAVGAMLARRRPLDPATRRLAAVFVPLLGVQIALGEYQYRTRLPWEVILVHVTVAGVLWSGAVALALSIGRPVVAPARRQAPAPSPDPDAIAPAHAAST